ncbi:Cytidylate kinase [Candidatus Methanobinarius endosymbioticus]|uniref:Cytidylate kinase n=1 Tax=Candidatus Methanobinarius endosymbioticus TaxID=2006182 RepID=A0A366M916_9EURY|nr:Cytidylate kinase [Candidatus Methanobinarius endosymbioticus]
MKVIGISGLPGSGKSLVTEMAKKRSISVIHIGDIVREEAKKRNAEVSETSVNLREEQGDHVLAKMSIEKINKQLTNSNDPNNTVFLIEGIRSKYEVDLFRETFKEFILLSIFSSPSARFDRIKNRKRTDDSSNYEKFLKRDERELGFGIGSAIATSDYIIINDSTLENYESQINEFFDKIIN